MKRWGSGKNINRRDRHGETPLHKVVTCGTVGEIGRLIRQGADVNARDNTDWTPLHVASLEGLPDAVECLLKAGADVNVAADGGTTPLRNGAISGCRKVVELLLHHGADAYSTDRCGKIPLEVSSSIEVRNCLLDHMRGTKKSSETSHPVSSESASSTHRKVSFIEIYSDGERSEPSSPSHCSSAMENFSLDHPESSSADRSAGDGLYTPLSPYMDSPGFFPDVDSREEEFHAEPDPSPTSTPVDVFKKPRSTHVSRASRSVSSSVLTLSSTSVAPSTSATALSANVVETRRRVTRDRSLFLRDGTNRGRVESGGYEGNMVSGDGCLVSGGRVVRSERRESSSPRRNDSYLDQGPSSIVTTMRMSHVALRRTRMKTHKRKLLKCKLCEQSFSFCRKLMHHLRSHTDQKMYVCVCEKEFNIRSRLFSHMRVHTGEKPFNCIVCQKSFPEKRSCNRHVRKH